MAITRKLGELTLHKVEAPLTIDKGAKTISGNVLSYVETEEGPELKKTSAFEIDEVDFSQDTTLLVDNFISENLETIVGESEDEVSVIDKVKNAFSKKSKKK